MCGVAHINFQIGLDRLPEIAGQYLRKTEGGGVELITVDYYPPTYHGGMKFEGHYGVVQHRGRHVSQYSGKFVEIVY